MFTIRNETNKYTAKAISRTARDRRPGIYGYAEAMLILYNGKNKKSSPCGKSCGPTGKEPAPRRRTTRRIDGIWIDHKLVPQFLKEAGEVKGD